MAFQQFKFNNFNGVATRWDPEKLPPGYAAVGRNVKFVGSSVKSRDGSTTAFMGPNLNARITGLVDFMMEPDNVRPIVCMDSDGTIFTEVSAGSGVVETRNVDASRANMYMEADTAQNKVFMAFSDLIDVKAEPRMYYRHADGVYEFTTVGAPSQNASMSSGLQTGVGDMVPGIRYAVTLFVTRSGYITGMLDSAVTFVNVVDPNRKVRMSGIPVGPTGTVARIIAFTESGASSAGPYFWITQDDVLEELNATITKTIIEDNTTTIADFNFTDDYLVGTEDVTNFFNKMELPDQISVYFSKALRRLVWAGEDQSTFRVSEPDDLETYFSTTGYVQPGDGDGQKAICAREFKGELYLLKDASGHLVVDSTNTPNTWKTLEKWTKMGPVGPRAVDVCDEFMAIASPQGLYTWDGAVEAWRSYEISGAKDNDQLSWDRINPDYAHLIWVTIDTVNKEIHVGVPLDQAVNISHEFVVNYAEGWKNRKWSLNDRQWTSLRYIKRQFGQMVGASAQPDGQLTYIDETTHDDPGGGFVSEFQTSFEPSINPGRIYQLGYVNLTAMGQGQLNVQVFPVRGQPRNLRQLTLNPSIFVDHTLKPSGQSERWAFRFFNNNDSQSWFSIQDITAFMNLLWQRNMI